VAERAEVVFASLPTQEVVAQAVWGTDGLAQAARPGLSFVDLSTNLPGFAIDLSRRLGESGVTVLDAPILGSPHEVADRSTAVIVGGPPEAFEQLRPLLEQAFGTVRYAGGPGAGLTVKLINNLVNYCSLGLAQEVLHLSDRAGVQRVVLYEVLQGRAWDGGLWCYIAEKAGNDPAAAAGAGLSAFKSSSSGLTGKSLAMAVQMGHELGVALPTGTALLERLDHAKAKAGTGD
jgi:3-hydroxyisobutyrate dehydrogenase-like beta-hydroxyacid dehydrogenase